MLIDLLFDNGEAEGTTNSCFSEGPSEEKYVGFNVPKTLIDLVSERSYEISVPP